MSGHQTVVPSSPEALALAQAWDESGRRLRAAYLSNAPAEVRRDEVATLNSIGVRFAMVCGVAERGIEFDRAMGAARTALTQQRVREKRAQDKEQSAVFEMQYECECGVSWTDTWSCACNDECPSCKREIQPTTCRVLGAPDDPSLAAAAIGGELGVEEVCAGGDERATSAKGVSDPAPAEEDSAMPGL